MNISKRKPIKKNNLADALKQAEQKRHYIIENASIDPIFLKLNENFINLKFNVAISIWFEEECSFKPLKEGGFLLHKPSGDFIFNKEEWSDLCRVGRNETKAHQLWLHHLQ